MRHNLLLALVPFAAGLVGCGSETITDTPDPEPQAELPSCVFTPAEHGDVCASEADCPLIEDVILDCELHDTLGMEVAAAADGSYVKFGEQLARVADDGGEVVGFARPGNPWYQGSALAVTADGQALAAFGRVRNEGGTEIFTEALGGDVETITAGERYRMLELIGDRDGGLHAWIDVGAEGVAHARRGAEGWVLDAPVQVDDYASRFILGDDGAPVSLHFVDVPGTNEDNQVALTAQGGTETLVEGVMSHPQGSRAGFDVAALVAGGGDPRGLMLLVEQADGLTVSWATDAGREQVVLPNTKRDDSDCAGRYQMTPGETCDQSACELKASQTLSSAAAITRTADGVAWVTYAVVRADASYADYVLESGLPLPFCAARQVRDDSRLELHVVRLAAGEAPEEVMVAPLTNDNGADPLMPLGSTATTVAHAHGTELAIAVDVRPDDAVGAYMRVLRIDTTRL